MNKRYPQHHFLAVKKKMKNCTRYIYINTIGVSAYGAI